MSVIAYRRSGYTSPSIGSLGSGRRHRPSRPADEALALVYVPAVISVGVNWAFFIAYWVPELGAFPGRDLILGQLAPVASKVFISQSHSVVWPQDGHTGLAGTFLLLVSLLLPPMARARYWVARLALWPLTYLAGILCVITVIGLLVRSQLGSGLVGVVLMAFWLAAAIITTWRSLWVDVDTLPKRSARVGWLLAAYVVFNPAPVAVGRRLFAPELRDAAVTVLDNGLTLRWTALLTPTTALVYLSGIALGAIVWAAYLLWPPRRAPKIIVPIAVLALSCLCLGLVAPRAARSAEQLTVAIRTESPIKDVAFTCGAWSQQTPGSPAQTLIVSGGGCRRVTAFTGYRQVNIRENQRSLSPVSVKNPDGRRLNGQLVAAQYGALLVLGATDRMDNAVTQLVGLRMADATQVWQYSCFDNHSMTLRFSGATGGDDPAAGRESRPGEKPGIWVGCGDTLIELDPTNGTPR